MADPGVLSALLGTANRLHASPKVRKALIEAGLVESGIRNLPYGDRDSLGVLQERTSIYGRAHALSPTASAERFIRAAQTANRPGLSAGALAQAVQRSAFPARYDEQSSAAMRLLGQNPGNGASGGSVAGSGGSLQSSLTSTPGSGTGFNPGSADTSSLAGLLAQPQAPPVPFPVAPTPAFQSPVIQPAQQPAGLADALAQVASTVPQGLPDVTAGSSTAQVSGSAPRASAASTRDGTVRVASSANAPGKNLTPGIRKLLGEVAAVAGPLTVGTGTNHSKYTVDGNVSDHYSGNAADLPTSPGAQNIKLGRQALVALGVPRSQADKAQGGIYNIPYGQHRRIQVIFNTLQGGDHRTHVHVGVTSLNQ